MEDNENIFFHKYPVLLQKNRQKLEETGYEKKGFSSNTGRFDDFAKQ